MSRSRSRSPHVPAQVDKTRKLVDEVALESLVSKKLAKWLSPDSEEIKLLAQFCATMAHSGDNWQPEIREEVQPFLHDDTAEFLEWLTKSRWKDEADNKFGKAALRLRERALQEASGTLPRPSEFKGGKGSKEGKRASRGAGGAGAGRQQGPKVILTPNSNVADYASYESRNQPNSLPTRPDRLDHHATETSLTACSSYATAHKPEPSDTSDLPSVPSSPGEEIPDVEEITDHHLSSAAHNTAPAVAATAVPTNGGVTNGSRYEMTFGHYDYAKEEYQNLTLDNEPTKDKVDDWRKIHEHRKQMLERQTKVLQDLLTKLNDPNRDEKQKEKLTTLVGRLKQQMQMIKKVDPPKVV
eukprot:GEMP01006146.1.p1 GENE.GEMP01006146.1~~GEMP01006146.1.p1  ORF type:complete len:365 (-),score=79.36 GEMP01006146.1:2781-3845(-)